MSSQHREKDKSPKPTKEEIFAKLNQSSDRTLEALMKAYEAGMKAGISEEEQDQVIELLRRAKELRDKIRKITSEEKSKDESKGTSA